MIITNSASISVTLSITSISFSSHSSSLSSHIHPTHLILIITLLPLSPYICFSLILLTSHIHSLILLSSNSPFLSALVVLPSSVHLTCVRGAGTQEDQLFFTLFSHLLSFILNSSFIHSLALFFWSKFGIFPKGSLFRMLTSFWLVWNTLKIHPETGVCKGRLVLDDD